MRSSVLRLVLCVYSLILVVHAIQTKIDMKSHECFSEEIASGGRVEFSFEVTHGGVKDIDVNLGVTYYEKTNEGTLSADFRPVSRGLHAWSLASRGTYSYTAPVVVKEDTTMPTRLNVCFDNQFSAWTPKWITFSLAKHEDHIVAHEANEVSIAESKLEHRLHDSANKMFGALSGISKLKTMEEEHRNMAESTNAWILYGSIVNGILVVAMAVFQFWFLKQFLSTRASRMSV